MRMKVAEMVIGNSSNFLCVSAPLREFLFRLNVLLG